MFWVLGLLICFCSITTGNGDQKGLLPAKDRSKVGNKIARRILEEIIIRNVSKQQESHMLGKDGHHDFVTSTSNKPASGFENDTAATEDSVIVKGIIDNKQEIRDKQEHVNQKPERPATRILPASVSVIPVSIISGQNVKNSTIIPKTNKTKDHSDIVQIKVDPHLHGNNVNGSKGNDSKLIEDTSIMVPENNINKLIIPLNRTYNGNTTMQTLRSINNNQKVPQSISYFASKLNHMMKMKAEPKKNVLFSNGYNTAKQNNDDTLNAKASEEYSETKPIKHSDNYSNNKIKLTYIKNLNINSHNRNYYNHEKFGQDKNKTKNYYAGHNLGNKERLGTQKYNPLLSIKSNVATENPNYDVYIPDSEEIHSRKAKNIKRIKAQLEPISVDYYFDRNDSEESDSEKIVDTDMKQLVTVRNKGHGLINFDQAADAAGRSDNDVMVTVLRDMIKMDSKTLVQYPWLKSVLEVRSGILKVIDLIKTYVYNNKIHPLDLELMKYLLYLYKSSSMKLGISERSPFSRPENSQLDVNPIRVPILASLLKNVKKHRHSPGRFGQNGEHQQLTILFDLHDFMNEVLLLLNGFHRKIQELATNNPYDHLYYKLKEEYLEHAKDPHLQVVLLHLSLSRLFEYIDNSAARVREGFYAYVQQHQEEVQRDREETAFILNILEELRWK